ncbi:phosphohistidine phosphatase SixA [Halioxenophilus aromaticivorans]|uniref:Phosphohistidine phosphatase SixA n=1 Tax=Halioxenophilus aromaticivorans TaxID=1306992 RepID=A0AAV3UAD7_9ALTE
MQILILRHGEADPYARPDCQRRLTGRGILETEAILSRQLPSLQSVTQIWASPYVRAQETARLVQKILPGIEVQTTDLLVPEANPQRLANAIEAAEMDSVLLVSHQPLVGVFLDWLAGLEPGSHRLGTSALACVETEVIAADCGHLQWVDQP